MKDLKTFSLFLFLICLQTSLFAQSSSPDKFINKIKKSNSAHAFTLPGWFVKMGGKIASKDTDIEEQEVIKELTSHIKKVRFVIVEELPNNYEQAYKELQNYMDKKEYESLISARDGSSAINLWALFDDQTIENLVISVMDSEGGESVFFNIKSNIDMNTLAKMDFFQEWKSL